MNGSKLNAQLFFSFSQIQKESHNALLWHSG